MHVSLLMHNGFLKLTFGVTSADLLAASMAAKQFQSTYLQTSIGGARVKDRACCYLTVCDNGEFLEKK